MVYSKVISLAVCLSAAFALQACGGGDKLPTADLTENLTPIPASSPVVVPAAKSEQNTQATKLTFVNNSSEDLLVCWLDYTGTENLVYTLTPNSRYTQATYVTHPWIIRKASTKEALLYWVADALPRIGVVN